ncbi:MAG: hypothetical protein Kow0047_08140 [Anaerolineae bacterium]
MSAHFPSSPVVMVTHLALKVDVPLPVTPKRGERHALADSTTRPEETHMAALAWDALDGFPRFPTFSHMTDVGYVWESVGIAGLPGCLAEERKCAKRLTYFWN